MLVDTVNRQAVEHIERAHPFRVTLGQVVVDRHHMHTVAGEGIQENRKGSHEGLSFTGSHFGNLSLVEHHAAKELHIIVDHAPGHLVATGHPVVFPDGLVAFDADKVSAFSCQPAVEFRGRHLYLFVFRQTAARILHDGKGCGQHIIQCLLILLQHLFFQLVNLGKNRLTLLDVRFFNGRLQFLNLAVFLNG